MIKCKMVHVKQVKTTQTHKKLVMARQGMKLMK